MTADLRVALGDSTLVVLAIPSQYLRGVARRAAGCWPRGGAVLSAAKGLELRTQRRMSQIITEELGGVRVAVLSGPNIASEIAQGHPASSVVASRDPRLAVRFQRLFMTGRLRVYTSRDVVGVELGGALKNPLAIAAGIADGLGFGFNAKAAIMTRGVAEMARLGAAMGANARTFSGLSGLGDLITTCLGGRNRWFGEQIGRGRSMGAILRSTPMVIEGVQTTKAAVALGHQQGVELPIIEQVYAVLFRKRPPRAAFASLMRRAGRSESS